ncbi:MAG: hypothetical protein AB7P08_12855 [Burkholderiales bacterium]
MAKINVTPLKPAILDDSAFDEADLQGARAAMRRRAILDAARIAAVNYDADQAAFDMDEMRNLLDVAVDEPDRLTDAAAGMNKAHLGAMAAVGALPRAS